MRGHSADIGIGWGHSAGIIENDLRKQLRLFPKRVKLSTERHRIPVRRSVCQDLILNVAGRVLVDCSCRILPTTTNPMCCFPLLATEPKAPELSSPLRGDMSWCCLCLPRSQQLTRGCLPILFPPRLVGRLLGATSFQPMLSW